MPAFTASPGKDPKGKAVISGGWKKDIDKVNVQS